MEHKPSLSIPYQKHYWPMRLFGLPMAVAGIWFFFFLLVEFWGAGVGFWLFAGVPTVVFCAFLGVSGLKLTFESFLVVHLVPEGIAVTFFGRNLRLYPLESIQTVYHRKGVNFNWIAVSCLSEAELVRRREEALRRGVFSKSGVDYKMTRPNWQEWFLREQLNAQTRKALLNPLQEDFLWMEFSPERKGFLRGMYISVPWKKVKADTTDTPTPWKDDNEYVFCRGLCKASGRLGAKVLILTFAVLPVAAMLLVPLDSVPVFVALLLGMAGISALFTVLWLLGRGEYDELWCYPDRLKITRKNKDLEVIPAEEVRTVLRGRFEQKGGTREFLAVSRYTEGELAEKILHRCRFPEQKQIAKACAQLPQRDRLLLSWYSGRWTELSIYGVPGTISLMHTPRREEVLKERYPGAKWVDIT